MVIYNVNILYTGNEPTFLISGKKNVTDLTWWTTQLGNLAESIWWDITLRS